MNTKLLKSIATSIAFTLVPITWALDTNPVRANIIDDNPQFICGEAYDPEEGQRVPTTFAITDRGKVAIINWTKTYFTHPSPDLRCQEVSDRFQNAYDSGTLGIITNATIANRQVICTLREVGTDCATVLLELHPEENSLRVLNHFRSIFNAEQVGPVKHSSGIPQIYYRFDIDEFLRNSSTFPKGLENKHRTQKIDNSTIKKVGQISYTGIVQKIARIAEQFTVKIKSNNSFGSGVIIAHQEDSYYVITASYVVDENEDGQILTPDGVSHSIDRSKITKLKSGLAIAEFKSKNTYTVATLANYKWRNQWIFTSGYRSENQTETRVLTAGKVFTEEEAAFVVKDAYSLANLTKGLVYTNSSYPGMGGGAVLDAQGRLIGINWGVEGETIIDERGNYSQLNLGYSLGISIQSLLDLLPTETLAIKPEWLKIETSIPASLTATEIATIQEQLQIVIQPQQEINYFLLGKLRQPIVSI